MAEANEMKIFKMKEDSKRALNDIQKLLDYVDDLTHLIIYKEMRENGDITFDQYAGLPMNVLLEYPTITHGKVISEKVFQSSNTIRFETKFEPGAIITRHSHSDCTEEITVLSEGKLKFVIGNEAKGTLKEFVIGKDETFTVPAGVDHQMINMSDNDALMILNFYRIQ